MATNPYLSAQNPYLQGEVNDAQQTSMQNWNDSAQPAFNSAMVNSGSFGNAGVQQMNNDAALTQQKALGSIATNMYGQDYLNQMQNWQYQNTSDQQNNQFNASQAQQNNQWQNGFNQSIYNNAVTQNNQNLQLGLGLLSAQNGYNTQNLANGTTIQNTPYNYWSNFSNAANSMGQGYGTSTGTVGSTSNPLTSALGGAQLASAAMGYWNSTPTSGGSSALNNTDANGYALANYGANGSAAGVTPYL